jgi:riboflavin synthase
MRMRKMADILILSVEKRKDTAVKVQEILTEAGCMIKTRLGLHESGEKQCSDAGLIILQLESDINDINVLVSKIGGIEGVKAKLVTI